MDVGRGIRENEDGVGWGCYINPLMFYLELGAVSHALTSRLKRTFLQQEKERGKKRVSFLITYC